MDFGLLLFFFLKSKEYCGNIHLFTLNPIIAKDRLLEMVYGAQYFNESNKICRITPDKCMLL